MAAAYPLLDLATQIFDAALAVNSFLVVHGHPQPSFAPDGQPKFPDSAPPNALECRRKLMEASRAMYDMASWPTDHIRNLSHSYHDNSTLRWIYRHGIAKIVPLEGDISYAEIASAANVDEGHARRILRFAMTNRIFREPRPGYVAHSASSSLLAQDEGIQSWVGFGAEEGYPTSARMVDAEEQFKGSRRTTDSAYNLAFDTDMPYFQHLALFPEREKRFAVTMEAATSAPGWSTRHLVDHYPWETIGQSTVVDVAGSVGHASIAIAEKATMANFIVQDLEQTVEQGRKALPPALEDRITFQAYDILTPQPVQADFYLLRLVLHDHPDEIATKILKDLVPVMKNGARVIINDIAIPGAGVLHRIEERLVRHTDLEMLGLFNSRERPLDDWLTLCKDADPRLKLGSVVTPSDSALSIIELVFQEDSGTGSPQ